MFRRAPWLLLALAGCGNTPAADLLREAIAPEPLAVPLREAAPPPLEPTLRLVRGGRSVLAVLVQQNGEQRMWRSADGVVVATDGARLVATAGIGRTWLAATRFDGPDPLDDPGDLLHRPATARRLVDLMGNDRSPERMRFGLLLECRLRAAYDPGGLLVTETCQGGGGGVLNRFWADPATGAVYRSEQWIGEAPPLTLEVVTPPAS
jgi:hypothetical protein